MSTGTHNPFHHNKATTHGYKCINCLLHAHLYTNAPTHRETLKEANNRCNSCYSMLAHAVLSSHPYVWQREIATESFFITLVQLFLWLPKSISSVLCILHQSKPVSSQFKWCHYTASGRLCLTLMFVFVQKAQTLASNESFCCVHSTTCSAAFGCGSDRTQNESLARVGLPFDGHKTVQLPQEVGFNKNTPLKSSSLSRHRGHCTMHMCICERECMCCVRKPFSLTLLSVLFRLRYFETKNEYFIGWLWGQ